MRISFGPIVLFAFLAPCLAQQSFLDTATYHPTDDAEATRLEKAWLHSGDPREMAWAAELIARNARRGLIPDPIQRFSDSLLAVGSVSACEFGSDSLMAQVATDSQLRLSVSTSENTRGNLLFVVTFENVSNKDLALNLGVSRDGVRFLTAISLRVSDSLGGAIPLFIPRPERGDPRTDTVDELDDYVLPLRAGSTYSLEMSLARFVGPPFRGGRLPTMDLFTGSPELVPGQYRVSAIFIGRSAQSHKNSEGQRTWIEVWKGVVQSPETEFRIK